jgi:hypothetical protein
MPPSDAEELAELRGALALRDREATALSAEVTARGTTLAALREENAREREAHLHWKTEAHAAIERSQRAHQALEDSEQENDHLRARVAALVQGIESVIASEGSLRVVKHQLTALLDSPDLADLDAREQQREAVLHQLAHAILEADHPPTAAEADALLAYDALDAGREESGAG